MISLCSSLQFDRATIAVKLLDLIDKKKLQLDAENREFRGRLDFDRQKLHKLVIEQLQLDRHFSSNTAEKIDEYVTQLARINHKH